MVTTKTNSNIYIDLNVLALEKSSDKKLKLSSAAHPDANNFLQELSKDFNVMIYSQKKRWQVIKWLTNNQIDFANFGITNSLSKNAMIVDLHLLNYHRNYNRMLKAIQRHGKN